MSTIKHIFQCCLSKTQGQSVCCHGNWRVLRSREQTIFIGERAQAKGKHNIRSPFSYFLFPASLQSENFTVSFSKWSMILIVCNQLPDPLTAAALLW